MARKHNATGEQGGLVEEIREVRRQIEAVRACFALETDDDLLDAAIYQHEALQARYRYLLRQARENNAVAGELPVEWENRERWIN
jgi:hypothetical protein